ncbi:MAG: RES domain-containing protein [Bryobacteraceae bacterium]
MIAANASQLKCSPHSGTWYRTVDPRFLSSAILTTHTTTTASRFSAASAANPGFEILYLAENPLVGMFEAQALFGSPLTPGGVVPHPTGAKVSLPVQVKLTAIVDLSDPAEAKVVDTNAQELTGDWLGYQQRSAATTVTGPTGLAPTQEFGKQLFSLCPGVRGFLSLSARLPYHRILAIFPQRLQPGIDSVSYAYLDSSGQIQAIQIP